MFLKSLELQGFKSFADKTKLEFDEGVTGIVGPNGCGKSNIVDAIRWVLGETSAKALRGGEMADVIFNGTDKRQAVGMAEVCLTLSGCEGVFETDFSEVSLGRRVFRDGKSEYLLNKQPCRLKDIHSMLMDTGIGRTSYSIMEQGKIDLLLSSKPEDRRAVFEEAAGITKFKAQKKEALRKLDYTEANLVRIRDIVEEHERQIRRLERQAGKARRFQALHTDVKVLDLHLSHKTWNEQRVESGELEISIRAMREKQDAVEKAIEDRQNAVSMARREFQEIESKITETQSTIVARQNAIQGANNRIEFNAERAHELSVLIKQNEADIDSTTSRLAQQETDLKNADEALENVDEKISQFESRLEEYENAANSSRNDRQVLGERLETLRSERTERQTTIATLDARIENHQRQLSSDQLRFQQLTTELGRLKKDENTRSRDANGIRGRIEKNRQVIEADEEKLAAAEDQYQTARRQLEDLQNLLGELHREHSEKDSRLGVLRQLIAEGEGFEKGTRAVLKGLGQPDLYQKAVRGALASFIEVDKEYVAATEAALGRHLQTIVVADTLMAENMIAALKKGQLGQATLVSEEFVKGDSGRQLLTVPDGAIGWALDKIQCDDRVTSLIDRLLENVLLVPDLQAALKLRHALPEVAMATLAGEFISAEGIIFGGASSDDSGSVLERQSEVKTLQVAVRSLSKELDRVESRRNKLQNRVEKLEDTLQSARARLQQKRVSFSTLEGQLNLVERELQQVENKTESLSWEQQQVGQRQDDLDEKLKAARAEKEEARGRIVEVESEFAESEQQLEFAEKREQEAVELLGEVRTSLAVERRSRDSLRGQREPMAGRLAELTELLNRRNEEITSYRTRIENARSETERLQQEIVSNEEEVVGLTERLERVRVERAERTEAIEKGEAELAAERREIQQLAEKRSEDEIHATQLDMRLEQLETTARDRYQTDLERFEPDSHALLAVIETQRAAHDRNQKRRATLAAKTDGDESPSPENVVSFPESGEESASEDELAVVNGPDWEFVEEIVGALRTKLDSMGPVNLEAIEEFEELEQTYRFNLEQMQDLENARDELMKMIARINRDTRKMFAETFEKIRVNFRDMFKELFGPQARSDLILLDEADPLESGIDVIAKPPGKKLQSISLLSGGERSMTAVALLFGIYMVKPSPFCVLDELDAPLDEANISRFIRVLDRFIGESQFIIVTHSKRTMSRADVMYGISMEEFGVSKTLGMKFSGSDEEPESDGAAA